MILTFLGCALRFTWVITIVNGRNAKAVLVSAGVESILLKVPQIFWIAAFLYTALVWRRLADQCSKLAHHKTNQKRTLAKLSLKINLFNLLLIGCCIPAYIVGNVSYPYLVWWVDYFMTFVVFGIFCLGVRFGWQLINQVRKGRGGVYVDYFVLFLIPSHLTRPSYLRSYLRSSQLETSVLADILIPTIKWVLRVASMGCWTTIIASFAYNMYFRGKGQWYALGYATMVHHFAETMLVLALLKTKKDAVKRAKANENMKGGMARGIGLGIGSRAASSSKFNSGFKGGSFRNASKAPTNSSMRFSEMSDVTNNTLRTTTMTTTSNTQEGAEIGKGRKMSKRDVSGEKMKKLELGKEQLPQHAAPAML